jgi:chaperone BCS1
MLLLPFMMQSCFSQTNHIDRLDPALVRPGRIDHKIEYQLATQQQAHGLFLKFFPEFMFPTDQHDRCTKESQTLRLADEFSSAIPPREFSMAELQGYLLGCKAAGPLGAARLIQAWVERELKARGDLEAIENYARPSDCGNNCSRRRPPLRHRC